MGDSEMSINGFQKYPLLGGPEHEEKKQEKKLSYEERQALTNQQMQKLAHQSRSSLASVSIISAYPNVYPSFTNSSSQHASYSHSSSCSSPPYQPTPLNRNLQDLWLAIEEHRKQDHPHQKMTNFDLKEILEKQGHTVKLEEIRQIIKASEVLQMDYFPGQKLDFRNPAQQETFHMLVQVQQGKQLETLDPLQIKAAQCNIENLVINYHNASKENVTGSKAFGLYNFGTTVASSVLGPITGMMGAGLTSGIASLTKPKKTKTLRIEDFEEAGYLRPDGKIHKEFMHLVEHFPLDERAKKLYQASAHFHTKERANHLEERVDVLELDNAIRAKDNEGIAILIGKLEEEQNRKKAALEQAEAQAKRAENWRKAERISSAVGNAFSAFDNYLRRAEQRKTQSKERVGNMRAMASNLQTALDLGRVHDPLTVGLNFLREDIRSTDQAIEQISNHLKAVQEEIEKEKNKRDQLQDLGDRISGSQIRLAAIYAQMEKERNKILSAYENIDLGANLIASVAQCFPGPGTTVAAALGAVNKGVQLLGNEEDRPFRKGGEKLYKEANKRSAMGGRFLNLASQNEDNLQTLISHERQLNRFKLEALKKDPRNHTKLMTQLKENLQKKEEELAGFKQEKLELAKKIAEKSVQKNVAQEKQQQTLTALNLQTLSLNELKAIDPDFVKEHAKDPNAIKNIRYDSARNIVMIKKSGKFRAYPIGNGHRDALIESKKESDVINFITNAPLINPDSEVSISFSTSSEGVSLQCVSTVAPLIPLVGGRIDTINKNKEEIGLTTSHEKASTQALDDEVSLEELNQKSDNLNKSITALEGDPEKGIEGEIQQTQRELDDAEKIQNIQAAYGKSLDGINFLVKYARASDDIRVNQILKNMEEFRGFTQEGLQRGFHILGKVDRFCSAIDDCFDTQLSYKLQRPSMYLAKGMVFAESFVTFLAAYDQIQGFRESRKKEAAESETPLNPVAVADIIRLGSQILGPGSTLITTGLELIALYNSTGKTTPTETQRLAHDLSLFRESVKEAFGNLGKYLHEVHVDMSHQLAWADVRLSLVETRLSQKIETLSKIVEDGFNAEAVVSTNRSIEGNIVQYHQDTLVIPYKGYFQSPHYPTNPKELTDFLINLETRTGKMHISQHNGLMDVS